jgi:hypothetical protein
MTRSVTSAVSSFFSVEMEGKGGKERGKEGGTE